MSLKYAKRHESCIGCGISYTAGCIIIDYLKDDEQCRSLCPCAECLVKPACKKYCDLRMALYNDINIQLGKLRDKK